MEANKPHMNKVEELVERGKAKGVLTYKEVMDTLEEDVYKRQLRRWMHCPLKNSRERHAWWTAPMRERTDGLRCGAFKTCARRQMKRNSCYFIRAGAAFGTMDATLARTLRLMRM